MNLKPFFTYLVIEIRMEQKKLYLAKSSDRKNLTFFCKPTRRLNMLHTISGTVVSVLGYCLIPIVGLSGLSVLFSLTGVLGNILTVVAVLWCTASSSKVSRGQH